MSKLYNNYRQQAQDIIGMQHNLSDQRKLWDWMTKELVRTYEIGRASMMIETQLKETLEHFVVGGSVKEVTEEARKRIKEAVIQKLESWYKDGTLESPWKPKIDVVQDEKDPTMIHVFPADKRTAQLMEQLQKSERDS